MKKGRIGKNLIKAIDRMEKIGDWPTTLLLLELAQLRMQASIKPDTGAVEGRKMDANSNTQNGQRD
jgi:hypothetical protein